jgi:tyrosinase
MAGNALNTALTAFLCLFSGASASPFSKRQALTIDGVQKAALANAYKVLDGSLADGMTRSANCTKNNVAIRKE